MTVGELLNRMSSQELTEWAVFYRLEAEETSHARKVADKRSRVKRR